MDTHTEWLETVSDECREASSHRDPGQELLFYRAVADGAISQVQENCDRRAFADPDGVGQLSDDPVTNLKYHFVVTAALITRFCTESGMPMEEAYRDAYYMRTFREKESREDAV